MRKEFQTRGPSKNHLSDRQKFLSPQIFQILRKKRKNHEKMLKIDFKVEKQLLSKNVMGFHKILHF